MPVALLQRDLEGPNPDTPELHATLLEVYREHPGLASLCERLVDLDEGFQEWRYRHVKMVERTIGSKTQFLILEALRQIDEARAGGAADA